MKWLERVLAAGGSGEWLYRVTWPTRAPRPRVAWPDGPTVVEMLRALREEGSHARPD